MPPTTTQRAFDTQAAQHHLARVSKASEPPWLHGEVANRMAQRLPLIRLQPKRLLDWWGFLGASSEVLLATYPQAGRDVVEGAFMPPINQAPTTPWWHFKKWSPLASASTKPGTVWRDAGDIDSNAQLIWANMVLHSVLDPLALMQRWHGLLEVDGFVMFSCLGPGSLQALRSLYQQMGWPSPAAAFVDMHDLGDMLIEAGFSNPVMDQETLTLHWANPEKLLAELRMLGGNAAPDCFAGLRTPRWHQTLLQALQSTLADPNGRLGLQFEVVYGHAFKAAPRWAVGEQTQVPLQDLRATLRAGRGISP